MAPRVTTRFVWARTDISPQATSAVVTVGTLTFDHVHGTCCAASPDVGPRTTVLVDVVVTVPCVGVPIAGAVALAR